MREERLVVRAEVDVRSTPNDDPEKLARHLLGLVRTKAEEVVAETKGAELRTDRRPAVAISQGTNTLTGLQMWLVWTNWYVWMPEAAAARLEYTSDEQDMP